MRRLIVFNSVSLDGYFVDGKGDMSWAHTADPEFQEFVQGNARRGGEAVFGRITYQLMESHWPTPAAMKNDPVVAKAMNDMSKVVFSRTLSSVSWSNTRLVNGDPVAEIRRMKNVPGPGMVIMGSGSIIAQLAGARVIDEYQVVVVPVVLGAGRTMFEGVRQPLGLKLASTRAFRNGNVFLRYEPKD